MKELNWKDELYINAKAAFFDDKGVGFTEEQLYKLVAIINDSDTDDVHQALAAQTVVAVQLAIGMERLERHTAVIEERFLELQGSHKSLLKKHNDLCEDWDGFCKSFDGHI